MDEFAQFLKLYFCSPDVGAYYSDLQMTCRTPHRNMAAPQYESVDVACMIKVIELKFYMQCEQETSIVSLEHT